MTSVQQQPAVVFVPTVERSAVAPGVAPTTAVAPQMAPTAGMPMGVAQQEPLIQPATAMSMSQPVVPSMTYPQTMAQGGPGPMPLPAEMGMATTAQYAQPAAPTSVTVSSVPIPPPGAPTMPPTAVAPVATAAAPTMMPIAQPSYGGVYPVAGAASMYQAPHHQPQANIIVESEGRRHRRHHGHRRDHRHHTNNGAGYGF